MKTRTWLRLTPVLFIAFSLGSCRFGESITGSGNVITETRAVGDGFKEVEVGSGIEVVIEQAATPSITVEADDNVMPHIKTTVSGGKLVISSDVSNYSNVTKKVAVRMPAVSRVESGSGSSVSSANILKSGDLRLKSSSGSSMNLQVEADNLSAETDSGSSMDLQGKAITMATESSSGSTLNAAGLLANDVRAKASSGSTNKVHAIVKLDAKASTGGSIENDGTPKELRKAESTGGSVNVK
jgi:hypothetical protein